MKIFCSIIMLLTYTNISAQLEAIFDYKKFNTVEAPFIETYLQIYTSSLFENSDSNIKTKGVEILQFIEDENNKIVAHKKYKILEKELEDYYNDIIDLQRFSLQNGVYEITIEITDINQKNNVEKHSEKINISFSDELEISDIEFLDSYWKDEENSELSKSGISMIPLVSNYFSPDFNKIAYYFEIYGIDKTIDTSQSFLLTQSIRIEENGEIAGQFNKLKKYKSGAIIPVINSFNIESLPTGNYLLEIELINSKNELIASRSIPFQRTSFVNNIKIDRLNSVNISNTFASRMPDDSLKDFLQCLTPISSTLELNIIDNKIDAIDDTLKRQFLYSFWYNRDPNEPEKAWEIYKRNVKKVNQLFSTKVRKGYQTDRGRIYLKYGPPNTLTDRANEPSAYPYQIWHYYKIGRFNNKRFIFYMPDLITNEYIILHSTLQGEYSNNKWQADLHKRNSPRGDIDSQEEGNFNHWGSNSNTFFNNP
jgi:GWxTD domain-containing protein